MPINSSYYTGVEWIDEKLAKLYEDQTRIEVELRRNSCGLFDNRPICRGLIEEHGRIIRRQDALLELVKMQLHKKF